MSSSDSQDISSSDAYTSKESPTSSSSTGSSSPDLRPLSVPNTTVPEPQPVNQMLGQVFQERDESAEDEPVPYDPDNKSYEEWEDRLEAVDYFPLPTSYPSNIYPHVSKIAQNNARRNLPEGYILEYDPNWPNIIKPHRDDRVGLHIISLESGTVFPLRPLLVELCHCFKILPGKITPNAHRFLNAFVNICIHFKINPSLRFFLYLFEVLPGSHHPSIGQEEEGENTPAAESLEELCVKLTLKLKEMGEVRSNALEQLIEDSSSRLTQLEENLKRAEAHNRELQELTACQLDEMANLSVVAGKAKSEILQLKEENTQLMGEVSQLKEEVKLKEEELLGRDKQWVGENLEETAWVISSTLEMTMEAFKFIYRRSKERR
ncbi:unnamed protein product [Cuscuta campestris]|uniref:Uncharacterized protein n=1 Tax=Cuscuta campestris TaxID=132261 RepID=A0A484MGC9_9ASTE|nr:unnamed protein product [Cuscuta campestris]